MDRLVAAVMFVLLVLAELPAPAPAQMPTDAQAAATAAIELSRLEARGDFNTLYDRIHPDAHAVVPRAAVIGWYQAEFAPLGAGVSTVTDVWFTQWTWPVTGQTYPHTAVVAFRQPHADGTVLEDVVHLVQDTNGNWRWFFGRSREFIEEQIARYAPRVPQVGGSASVIELIISDLNSFWAFSFTAAGEPYTAPNVVAVPTATYTSCGVIDQTAGPATFCPAEETIFYSPGWFGDIDYAIGDFAWITIMAHEWAHYVQYLRRDEEGTGNQQELQADCLAGSYARDAETRGLLDPGDVTEAVTISAIFGDPVGLPQDTYGAHGTSDDRVAAFMRGYLDGFVGCGFVVLDRTASGVNAQPITAGSDLMTLLPLPSEVPANLQHIGDNPRSLADVVSNYTDPAQTEARFTSWGWKGNATCSYSGNGQTNGITSIYTSIHRFDSDLSAAQALNYSVNDQAASTGAWEVAVSSPGTTTRALATSADVTIYAQQGDIMIRLTVAAAVGDPMTTASTIMRSLLAKV